MLALYLFAQVSLWDLQVLSHFPVFLEQRQVSIRDPNQLGENREAGGREGDKGRGGGAED